MFVTGWTDGSIEGLYHSGGKDIFLAKYKYVREERGIEGQKERQRMRTERRGEDRTQKLGEREREKADRT